MYCTCTYHVIGRLYKSMLFILNTDRKFETPAMKEKNHERKKKTEKKKRASAVWKKSQAGAPTVVCVCVPASFIHFVETILKKKKKFGCIFQGQTKIFRYEIIN